MNVLVTGTFKVRLTHPPWMQRGTTMRFKFKSEHVLDGVIGTPTRPFTTPLTATILDRFLQAAQTAFFTVGAVTNYPTNTNEFYVDVSPTTVCDLQYFEIRWTAGYTPVAGPPALAIQSTRGFRVFQPAKPSKHYFYDTKTFGAH